MSYFEENRSSPNLSRQSVHSGLVLVVARGVNAVIQIGSIIFLARLLAPSDFGLFAMVSALTGIAQPLLELGLSDATVQRSKITHGEMSALFWLTAGLGFLLTALVALASPLIAGFYHEPRLQMITIASSLYLALSALSLQHQALLRRSMMFHKIAVIEITANVFGTSGAVAMALAGSGYWALVFRPILTAFFTVVVVWLSCRWIPGIGSFSQGVKEMIRFGSHITGFTITDYVGRAADRVGLGYTTGANELGYYQSACVLYENPLGIFANPLHSVAVASLSKLRDNLEELRRSWSTALSSLTFFAMPAFVILAVTAPDLVVLLLGDKWVQAGTILSIVALRGPAHIVERTLGWLHVTAGRADRWMRWGLMSSLAQVIALLFGLPFGAIGIATSYTVFMYVMFVPAIVYAGRPLGIGLSHLTKVVGPQLAGALCAAITGFVLRFTWLAAIPWTVRIALLILACAISYLLVTVAVFRVTRPFMVASSLFQDIEIIRFFRFLRLGLVSPNSKTK